MADIAEYKKKIVENIVNLISQYPMIAAINMENLPAPQLQKMRAQLRDKVAFSMTKRRLMKIAIEKAKESKKGIEGLEKYLEGMPALIFTKENPFRLSKVLQKSRTQAPARAGQTAPRDIVVPAGPTSFAPGPIIAELAQIGIKAGVEGGKVAIKQDSVVVKKGDKISAKAAEILTRFGIEPMEIGLELVAAYENGTIYTKDILEVDEEKFMKRLSSAANGALNLAMFVTYPTGDTIQHLVSNAFNDARSLSLSQNIVNESIIGDLLAKAERGMLGLKNTAGIEVKEKVEEKAEEEKPKERVEEKPAEVKEKKPEVKKEEKPVEKPKAEEKKEEAKPVEKPKKEIKVEKKEEKILEEEKKILKEEKELEKEKPKDDAPIEKEVQKEVKEEEEKQLEKERIEKEKEFEKLEKEKPVVKKEEIKVEEKPREVKEEKPAKIEKPKIEEKPKEIKKEKPEVKPKIEVEEKKEDTSEKIAKMVEKTKRFAEGKEPTAAKLVEEEPKEEQKIKLSKDEKGLEKSKTFQKDFPTSELKDSEEIKEIPEKPKEVKKEKKEEKDDVAELFEKLQKKGTLRDEGKEEKKDDKKTVEAPKEEKKDDKKTVEELFEKLKKKGTLRE